MTTRYSLRDIPSSSLLAETANLGEVAVNAAGFVHDNGIGALDDLMLGVSTPSPDQPIEYTGKGILPVLKVGKPLHVAV